MTYKTIKLLEEFIANFKYVNPCELEHRTFEWTDVWFGYREKDFYHECGDSEFAKRDWDDGARLIDITDLERGENILTFSYYQKSKSLDGKSSGSLTHKDNFSYDKELGFTNKFTKITLKDVLHLTEEENTLLNNTFEKEEDFKTSSLVQTKPYSKRKRIFTPITTNHKKQW